MDDSGLPKLALYESTRSLCSSLSSVLESVPDVLFSVGREGVLRGLHASRA